MVSIKIIEVFVKLRETILTHKDILLKLQEIESQTKTHDDQILLLFEEIKHQKLEQILRKINEQFKSTILTFSRNCFSRNFI